MNPPPPIKILLVGDYLIFRLGLKKLVEGKENLKVVGEAANLSESCNLVIRNKPNIILINESEVYEDDFDSFFEQHCSGIPVLILSDREQKKLLRKCFEMGISGLLSKDQGSEILFRAIEKVHDGHLWFDRALMGQTIRQLIAEKRNGNGNGYADICATLTDREMEVLTQVCKGLKNKSVGEKLFISETTVRHHLTSIFEKLHVNTRLQLVVLAYRNQLIEILPKNNGHHDNF